jgi:hypothetical protein
MKTIQYFGPRKAARCLGVGVKRIYELLYDERLPGATKISGRWRIPQAALEARQRAKGSENGTPGD